MSWHQCLYHRNRQSTTSQASPQEQQVQQPPSGYLGGKHALLFWASCTHVLSCFCHVWIFVTPWTVARQAPLSTGFPRQEYWSGLPFPHPGDLPDPGIRPGSPALQAESLPLSHWGYPLCLLLILKFSKTSFFLPVPFLWIFSFYNVCSEAEAGVWLGGKGSCNSLNGLLSKRGSSTAGSSHAIGPYSLQMETQRTLGNPPSWRAFPRVTCGGVSPPLHTEAIITEN